LRERLLEMVDLMYVNFSTTLRVVLGVAADPGIFFRADGDTDLGTGVSKAVIEMLIVLTWCMW
jgi:hypothetical protein